jgi:hypothetical protein
MSANTLVIALSAVAFTLLPAAHAHAQEPTAAHAPATIADKTANAVKIEG